MKTENNEKNSSNSSISQNYVKFKYQIKRIYYKPHIKLPVSIFPRKKFDYSLRQK